MRAGWVSTLPPPSFLAPCGGRGWGEGEGARHKVLIIKTALSPAHERCATMQFERGILEVWTGTTIASSREMRYNAIENMSWDEGLSA